MFDTLPGFREFYPETFVTRRALFAKWRESLIASGFSEYDCAVLEPLDLYIEKSGQEIVDQLFHFVDKGERKVALRPEMTPTLARMVGAKANALRKPVKWFNIGDHFRYERMQKGRTRCFTQLNVDILGEAGVAADVESIYSLILVCKRFGLNKDQFYIRLSDRNLWLLAFEALEVPTEAYTALLGVIDKMERMKEEAIVEALDKNLGEKASDFRAAVESFFELRSVESIQNWFSAKIKTNEVLLEKVNARLSEWAELTESLKQLGCEAYYQVDLSIVRGLAYYTGFVFEAFERGRRSRALAGGGRYDQLVGKLGGPEFPAVGWAMGDVTLLDCLEFNNLLPSENVSGKVFVIVDDSTRALAMRDVSRLRESGFTALYSYKKAGFGKQMKEANQNDARFALIYGEEVLKESIVVIKDLSSGESTNVPVDEILEYLAPKL